MFGEGPAERRERLRILISRLSDDEIAHKLRKKEEQEQREEAQREVSYKWKLCVFFTFYFYCDRKLLGIMRVLLKLKHLEMQLHIIHLKSKIFLFELKNY